MGQQNHILTLSKFQCDYKNHHFLVISSPGWLCEAWFILAAHVCTDFIYVYVYACPTVWVVCIILLTLVPSTTRWLRFLLLLIEMITFCPFQRRLLSQDDEFPRGHPGACCLFHHAASFSVQFKPPREFISATPTHCKQLCFTYCSWSRNLGSGQACKMSWDFALPSCPCPYTPETKFEGFRSHD